MRGTTAAAVSDESRILSDLTATARSDLGLDRLDPEPEPVAPETQARLDAEARLRREHAAFVASLPREGRRGRREIEGELDRAERRLEAREAGLRHAGPEMRSRAEANLARVEETVARLRAELGLDRAVSFEDDDEGPPSECYCRDCGELAFPDAQAAFRAGFRCTRCWPPSWAATNHPTRKGHH